MWELVKSFMVCWVQTFVASLIHRLVWLSVIINNNSCDQRKDVPQTQTTEVVWRRCVSFFFFFYAGSHLLNTSHLVRIIGTLCFCAASSCGKQGSGGTAWKKRRELDSNVAPDTGDTRSAPNQRKRLIQSEPPAGVDWKLPTHFGGNSLPVVFGRTSVYRQDSQIDLWRGLGVEGGASYLLFELYFR